MRTTDILLPILFKLNAGPTSYRQYLKIITTTWLLLEIMPIPTEIICLFTQKTVAATYLEVNTVSFYNEINSVTLHIPVLYKQIFK